MLVDITHPAHVHFFRNSINVWTEKGHTVIIASRDKDLTIPLLDCLDLQHTPLGTASTTQVGLAVELIRRSGRLRSFACHTRPDVMTAIAGTFIAPVGKWLGIPTVTFYDTEHAAVSNLIVYPLSTHLVVPSCYRKNIRRHHERYDGYHELSYLHPKYFTPDSSVLDTLGVSMTDPFVILRFVSWTSGHDFGHSGMSLAMKRKAVSAFSQHAKVYITSEKALPEEFEPYRIPLPPDKMHDALAYATLLYGESATMASEAAVLATPAIYLDNTGRGYTDEQERVYGAVFNFTESPEDQERSIAKGVELLTTDGVKDAWRVKRDRILSDKIDVTSYVVDFIEKAGKS
ncbi:DUF354 domain-containing protein [Candidatus Latescibacterota bacterium]